MLTNRVRGKRKSDVQNLLVIRRAFKVRDFGWMWAQVRVVVHDQVFIIDQVIDAQPMADAKIAVKSRRWLVVQNDDNLELGCVQGNPQSWMFQCFEDGYEAIHMADNVNRWAKDYRLPSHALWSTRLGVLYGHAVAMRADNPASIERVRREAAVVAGAMDSDHPLVNEARERLLKVTKVTNMNFPREYARIWSAAWLLDEHWQRHLTRVVSRYTTLRDAMMAYMGEAAMCLHEVHDDLVQIVAADKVDTAERPERLQGMVDSLRRYQGVSPFHKVLWHLIGDAADHPGDLNQAIGYCERGMGEEARAVLKRALHSLAFVLARYRIELQVQKVSAVRQMGGMLVDAEREVLLQELQYVHDVFEGTPDRDFAVKIRDEVLNSVTAACGAAEAYSREPNVRYLDLILEFLHGKFVRV